METKKPWQSKTILVNAVIGVGLAISPFMPGGQIVADWLSANLGTVGLIWSVLNIALRAITKGRVVLVD